MVARSPSTSSNDLIPSKSDAKVIIAAMLEKTSRHLFGPTSAPAFPPKQQVVSLTALTEKLSYLKSSEIKLVKRAFHFADEAHLGQYRQSGEPYITHPLAVAELCADWRLDVYSIMCALLHDVIEDTGHTHAELIEAFGPKVGELVDGLTKLDKLEFQSHAQAQAESFRKMFMAMARDIRVILVKLADRTHNMRTLDSVRDDKRKRIAIETSEIYAPIAHRLGLNMIYRELEDLSFKNTWPMRYRALDKSVKKVRGNRKEIVSKILDDVRRHFAKVGLEIDIRGREKTLSSIYHKMRTKHLSFNEVLDVYGFRVLVKTNDECYRALGMLHSMFKPMPGKVKDYIAIPKLNGYQSLHTTMVGPVGMPIEFQIRTFVMDQVADAGVAAHWVYKDGQEEMSEVQKRAHQWLQSLIDIEDASHDPQEFLEHVKIDLFPDSVYVFTPKGHIRALPRGATALDFAYSVHSDLGNSCVAVRINGNQLPLRTEIKNGDIVEVITAPYSNPNPTWLMYIKTGRARAAIRHALKTKGLDESLQLGERLLLQAIRKQEIDVALLTNQVWEKILHWTGSKSRQEIMTDLALGRRSAPVLAKRIELFVAETHGHEQLRLDHQEWQNKSEQEINAKHARQILIVDGSEGMSIIYSTCCHPIPGDTIIGYLGKGEGLQIHIHDCAHVTRIHRKDPDNWIEVNWAEETHREFEIPLRVDVKNTKGVLAKVANSITSSDANITHVGMDDSTSELAATIRFGVQVKHRDHLAQVMRSLRANHDVVRVVRSKTHH
ncbi:MAG: bifunctional (p)ppGpp synthetase/guanosine-3',5'-bis(diphosphate) 3'-pyrophosphohydrolase [Betaproteobacteria bacterium]